MDEDEIISKLERDLKRARELLRDWRDKYGGKGNHVFRTPDGNTTASPSDLLRETNHFLENR